MSLLSYCLGASALTIEITETTLMRNGDDTARHLNALKHLGVRIAIEDFGTGYSSLAHIQRLPLDSLKIDHSFISGLAHDAHGETLSRTPVQLGTALSIATFAEGIEQQQELPPLQGEDCDSGQGFLFTRPLDVAAAEASSRSCVPEVPGAPWRLQVGGPSTRAPAPAHARLANRSRVVYRPARTPRPARRSWALTRVSSSEKHGVGVTASQRSLAMR